MREYNLEEIDSLLIDMQDNKCSCLEKAGEILIKYDKIGNKKYIKMGWKVISTTRAMVLVNKIRNKQVEKVSKNIVSYYMQRMFGYG